MASNYFDKASLVMIPDAPLEGKVLSVKPEDRSGDFAFSRGSNLAATRVDANGLIEKGRENALLQSNTFNVSPWNTNLVTATSGQSGYDGSSDSWKIDLTGTAGNLAVGGLSVGDVGTYSVYAKAGTLNWILLGSQSGNIQAYINLSDGSIGATGAKVIEAKTEDVGSGWYRCSMTYSGTATVARVYPAQANGNLTATSGNIYIQDAQLEQGMVATDYIETGASTVQAGILEDLPRLDYSGGASCPSLLLEPQRSNLITNSEYFSDSYWTKQNAALTNNAAISPEGVNNSTKLVETATTDRHRVYGPATFTSGTNYTLSVFVKKNSSNRFLLLNANNAFNARAALNLDTLEITNINGTNGKVEDYSNGWYRFSISGQSTTSSTQTIFVQLQNAATDLPYLGDGSSLYLFGAQLEQGSYATSYIPAYGSAVTRSGDSTSVVDVSSLDVTANYTLFYEVSDFNVTATSTWVRQNGSNGSALEAYGSTMIIWIDGGVWYPFGHGVSGVGSNTKKAITYDGVKVRAYSDGVLIGSRDADKNRWDNLTNFDMTNGSLQMVNWNQILIFPTALTDQEAIDLTTI